jgi:hypothetical protein
MCEKRESSSGICIAGIQIYTIYRKNNSLHEATNLAKKDVCAIMAQESATTIYCSVGFSSHNIWREGRVYTFGSSRQSLTSPATQIPEAQWLTSSGQLGENVDEIVDFAP